MTQRTRPARLGLITDGCSRCRCLLDTGSQVSLWPSSPAYLNLQQSNLRLTAVNGTPIKAFGQEIREIKISGKSYSFMFLIAQVSRPMLGLDFLQAFRMTIDLGRRQLIHSGVFTRFSSTSSEILGVNMVRGPSPFLCVLDEFPEVVDASLATCTSCHGVECYINTNKPPIKMPPRRLTPEKLQVAKQYFDMMTTAGIYRRSDFPWSSGLHMVPKKDGTTRPCGNYSRLNKRTVGDAYPIPHVHDFAAGLASCTVFLKVDLVKGYHQVPVRAKDVLKTAIATPFGLFEFTRMTFGLKNSEQTFQRLMDNVTSKLRRVFVYLYDVLVASNSAAQHEREMRELFSTLRQFGLVLNSKKCVFGVRDLEFLGHHVSAQGIRPLPEKVEAVRQFERPRSVNALQRFLGLINFY